MTRPHLTQCHRRITSRRWLTSMLMPALLLGGTAFAAERRCEWVGEPTPAGPVYGPWRMTDPGNFWDTWERKCTTTWSGEAVWVTTIWTRSCTVEGGVGIGSTGPSGQLGGSYTWTEQIINTQQGPGTATRCKTETACRWVGSGPPDSGPGHVVAQMTHYTHEVLVNLFDDAVTTFDGQPFPYLSKIDLEQLPLGPHVLVSTPNSALPVTSLTLEIDLQPSYTLEQVGEGKDIVPHSIHRFTNDSPYDVFVDLTAIPGQIGLETIIHDNQRLVPAGGTTDVKVEYYSLPGYVALDQQQLLATVEVREIMPGGPLLVVEPGAAVTAELAVRWSDDLDAYLPGPIVGQCGWEAWDEDPVAADFQATTARAHGGAQALEIDGFDDAVHRFGTVTEGTWEMSAWQYVPANLANGGGQLPGTYFMLLNTYQPGGPYDWSVMMRFDGLDGRLKVYHGNGLNTIDVPYVADRWVRIQAVVDLDKDWTQVYYDDALVAEYSWTGGVFGGGGGALDIAAIDLFAQESSSVHYDDLRLRRIDLDPACPEDINRDGAVDVLDLLILLFEWGAAGGVADVNGDGIVDVLDLIAVLAAWGPC